MNPQYRSIALALIILWTLTAAGWLPSIMSLAEGADEVITEKARKWKVVKMNGIDYVTVEKIKAFYRFDRLFERESGSILLKHPTVIVEMDPATSWIQVNGIRIRRLLPYATDDNGNLLVSTTDLTKTLDPVLRPSYITSAKFQFTNISVKVTKEEGLSAPIDSVDPPKDTSGLILLHIQPSENQTSLRTEVLAPAGINLDGEIDEDFKPLPGNKFDSLNISIGVACHSHLVDRFNGINDEGVHRSRHEELANASIPTIRLVFSVSQDFTDWNGLSVRLEDAAHRFRKAVDQ